MAKTKLAYGRGTGIPSPVDVHVGARLRVRRTLLGMSQTTLGEMEEALRCPRLAEIRFEPRSYFCTCWKVRPMASPNVVWLMPNSVRRTRSRAPTCTSIGFGIPVPCP